ncbi:hypothetical protein M8845_18970 [Gelidibacter japonicus]|uniref:hypothetical protein n=1 Tax=Gelidibacter japonicus TaxID=1962232 RepID=UPI0020220BC4|nr:hypothetical protein [Gelidibacter japonicus]MCL8009511.1 hypothetical protein [Gelidibacter japonicus]
MDLTRHCELCDNQKTDLKIGTTCGLTDRKPEFNKTCAKIKLTDKFENKLKSVNIEYENFKRKKTLTYIYFAVFLVIGIAVIVGGYMLGKYALNSRVISTVPIIIMGVGLAPLGMAFGTLNKYRQDIGAAKYKKDRIDEVLNEYRIEYNINIMFGKEIHGTQEVYADLKTKGIR